MAASRFRPLTLRRAAAIAATASIAWPVPALAHPDATTTAGSRAYLISAGIVAIAFLAVGLVTRVSKARAQRKGLRDG